MMQQELNLGDASGVTLFGVGGAGGNAVSRLFRQPETGMKIICANTDVQAMRASQAAVTLTADDLAWLGRNCLTRWPLPHSRAASV